MVGVEGWHPRWLAAGLSGREGGAGAGAGAGRGRDGDSREGDGGERDRDEGGREGGREESEGEGERVGEQREDGVLGEEGPSTPAPLKDRLVAEIARQARVVHGWSESESAKRVAESVLFVSEDDYRGSVGRERFDLETRW